MLATKINKNQWSSFVFALMKCSYAAFGEQNKIDNDCKCQQVYKTQKNSCFTCVCELFFVLLHVQTEKSQVDY